MSSILFTQVKNLLSSGVMQEYVDRARSVPAGEGYPYLTYFGVNYRGRELLNIKVYFTFFRRLSAAEIKVLLPESADFNLNYFGVQESMFISPELHGTTFAFKLSTDGIHTNYFHYKTNEAMNVQPARLILTPEDLARNRKAYSCEYRDGRAIEKRYSFAFDDDTKIDLLRRFGVKFFTKDSRLPYLIEYTELDRVDKIILAIDDVAQQQRFVRRELDSHVNELVDLMSDKYGLMSASPGFYSDGVTRAIYFVSRNEKVYLQSGDTIGMLKHTLFK